MKIYNSAGVQIADIQVSDDSYRYRSIMGENSLTLKVQLFEHTEIEIGSYVNYQGEIYTLMRPQNIKKNNNRNFEYTIIFESAGAILSLYKFKNPVDNRLKFSLTEKPQNFLQMIVDNLNIREPDAEVEWEVGSYIESPEKTLAFNHNYCSDAIKMIADEFETEFEIVGKVISLRKVEYNKEDPIELSYGKGNGFKSGVRRENFNNSKAVEILYVQGGERNIDRSKYGSKDLLLPRSEIIEYEGKTYVSDELGYSISRQGKIFTNRAEDSLDCTHIYPSRVGIVSEVVTVDALKNLYYIKDSSIPSSLDYSLCRIAGEKATIKFETGMLAGKEFDIQQTDSAMTGYVHAERLFKIVPQEIDGVTMPSETYKPVAGENGDKYAVFGIHLPDAYINDPEIGAEWKMFKEAAKYYHDNENPRFSFTGELDPVYAQREWLNIGGKIKLGGYVSFSDEQFQDEPVLIRIIGIKDYINKPYSPQIELSNVTIGVGFATAFKKNENTEVIIDSKNRDTLGFAKRGFREAKETSKALENALLNFSGSINPIVIQTMQILLGDESLQFYFVDDKTTPERVDDTIIYNPATKQLTADDAIIQHRTIGIDTIKNNHDPSEFKYWSLDPYNSGVIDAEESKVLYFYAFCSKSSELGFYQLSDVPVGFESIEDYYCLLIGILSSEYDGDRSFIRMYGFTEITPGRITVDKIISPSGDTYIDLLNDVICGNIKFISNGDETDINEALANLLLTSQSYADLLASGLQDQIDGVIDTWFYEGAPTNNTLPTSEWTTENIKLKHIGDVYTNTEQYVDDIVTPDAGKAWRWVYENGAFKWTPIADSDAVLALQRAALAQDTADHKRRVFTSQPVTPYEAGDLWTQGAFGDLMVCQTERLTGSYISLDWKKASKYTDDTTANEAWDYADAVAGELADLEVGGENVAEVTELAFSAPSQVPPDSNNSIFKFITKDVFAYPDANDLYLKNGQSYVLTISESIKLSGTATRYSVLIYDFSTQQFSNNLDESFAFSSNKQIIKFTTPVSGNWSLLIYAGVNNSTAGNSVEYKGIMLQEGNKETTYQTATKYLTNVIKNGYTDVYGGLLATNVIFFKNALEQVTGGVSGLDEDNIGFWTGGTYLQALANTAKIILRKDGSGHLAGGGIKWDALASLVEFVGKITATEGRIGGLTISDGSLISNSMSFAEEAVEALSTLKTPVTYQITNDTTWSDEAIGSSHAHAYTQDIVIGLDSMLKFRASATPDTTMSECGWEIYIEKAGGGRVYQHSGSGSLSLTLFQIPIKSGTYTLHVLTTGYMYLGESYYNEASIAGEAATPTVIKAYGFLYKTKIGNNGLFSFWGDANYLYYSASHGLEYKGTMNIPGVLAAGSVASNGTHTNKWGAKVATSMQTITMQDTIIYVIPHNIGHANYSAQATATEHSRVAYVWEKNANNIKIAVRNLSGTNVLAQFDYLIIGSN